MNSDFPPRFRLKKYGHHDHVKTSNRSDFETEMFTLVSGRLAVTPLWKRYGRRRS